jgi:putative endonuclease
MYFIYILYSETANKFYIGQTSDVERRLNEHNHPIVKTKFTAKYLPWALKLSFPVSSERADVMKVEKFIKTQKNRRFILQLIENKDNPKYFEQFLFRFSLFFILLSSKAVAIYPDRSL